MQPTHSTALPDRVWRSIEADSETGCWRWKQSLNSQGYGQVMVSGRPWRVHRLIYSDVHGSIAVGLVLDHLCRNRWCCNPDHLEPVTDRTNVIERGFAPTAINARKTECVHGHPFDAANTMITTNRYGNPERHCRECGRIRQRGNPTTAARRSARIKCPDCGKGLAFASIWEHQRRLHPQA